MKGSIALARSQCVEIEGYTDDDQDMEGLGYSSVDVAEILSAEVERLRAREETLENALFECLVILEFEGFGGYDVVVTGKELLDPAQEPTQNG